MGLWGAHSPTGGSWHAQAAACTARQRRGAGHESTCTAMAARTRERRALGGSVYSGWHVARREGARCAS
eukprot:3375155-Prymnesium_polylepis.1